MFFDDEREVKMKRMGCRRTGSVGRELKEISEGGIGQGQGRPIIDGSGREERKGGGKERGKEGGGEEVEWEMNLFFEVERVVAEEVGCVRKQRRPVSVGKIDHVWSTTADSIHRNMCIAETFRGLKLTDLSFFFPQAKRNAQLNDALKGNEGPHQKGACWSHLLLLFYRLIQSMFSDR